MDWNNLARDQFSPTILKTIFPTYRHKWGSNSRKLIVSCKKCGCVREFVSGKATYFINDNVYLKSPNCKP